MFKMDDHPTVGREWVVIAFLMVIVIFLKRKGYAPISAYGMAMGAAVCWIVNTAAGKDDTPLQFEPEQFMYILLPPIVLCSGLKFTYADARQTLCTSVVFAWLATIGSALWVAFGLWSTNMVEAWIVAFWLGSIVSPTDPVGTLDMMKSIGDHPIRMVLEHESLLNDAVAIMLVHTSSRAWHMSRQMSDTETMEVISVALGMTLLSFLFGFLFAYSMRKILGPLLCIIVGMCLFSLCEAIGASGIIALFVFGASIRICGQTEDNEKILEICEYVSDLSETYVYVTIGGVVTQVDTSYIPIGVAAAFACLIGRIINIFLFGYLMRIGNIVWCQEELLLMSSCGMRGAVSLALAISAPTELKGMMVTATVTVVIVSMMTTSIATRTLLELLPHN